MTPETADLLYELLDRALKATSAAEQLPLEDADRKRLGLAALREGATRAMSAVLKEHPGVENTERCSFCSRTKEQVARLIDGGPARAAAAGSSAFICNECIDLCQQILREEPEAAAHAALSGDAAAAKQEDEEESGPPSSVRRTQRPPRAE